MGAGDKYEVNSPKDDEPPAKVDGSFGGFLWNSREKTVLGRTGMSWLKIFVFYCILYACLAGWFAGLLNIYFTFLSEKAPTYYGEGSLTKANPALGVRPMPVFDSTLIRFSQGDSGSYRPFVDHFKAFLKTYEMVNKSIDCAGGKKATEDLACTIPVKSYLEKLNCTSDNDYGYFTGSPCVALKMNKLYGFEPEPYANRAEIDADLHEGERIRDPMAYSDGNVGISCDGQNAIDKQNINSIKFAPESGLSMDYFPYFNQPDYRSPLVIARIDVEKLVTIQVNCRLWAKNIDNSDGKQKRGTIHFEFYID